MQKIKNWLKTKLRQALSIPTLSASVERISCASAINLPAICD